MLRTSLALTLIVCTATGVFAQTSGNRGTDKEQQACTRDVSRHCRKVMNEGDMVVLQCLQQNRKKLSKACRQVLEDHGQ